MGKKVKTGKNRQDKYYHLAKEQGFRSRASFKLVQLNKRFDFLSTASKGVLDLCAAPGGWMQVARKHMPVGSPCIGVDLVSIRPIPGCISIIGDITTESCRADIRRSLKSHPSTQADAKVDVVLNDGSPNMGKAWLQDAYTQSELTLAAVKLASEFLAPGGSFVTKIFRSVDYSSLMFVMNQLFRKVNATKPSASRAESAEIYVLCSGFLAPKSIDARLLNPKYVFKDMGSIPDSSEKLAENAKKDLVLSTVLKGMLKRKRYRDGYADGALTLYNRISALEFCRSQRPVAMMCEASAFSVDARDVESNFDKTACAVIAQLPETSEEVLHCCSDLKVLARREFKLLLKWRVAVRAALQTRNLLEPREDGVDAEHGESSAVLEGSIQNHDFAQQNSMSDSGESNDGLESEAELDEELQRVRTELEAKEKRKKRKSNKLRSALQRKIDMKIVLPQNEFEAGNQDRDGLFQLSTVSRAEKRAVTLPEDADPNDADDESCQEEDKPEIARGAPYVLKDSEEAVVENEENLVEELDHWYKVYLSRRKKDKNGVLLKESKERKRKLKRLALKEAQEAVTTTENGNDSPFNEVLANSSASSDVDSDSADEIKLGSIPVNSREAAIWFSQPVFAGAVLSSDDDVSGEEDDDGKLSPEGHELEYGALNSAKVEIMDGDLEGNFQNIHAAALREASKRVHEKTMASKEDDFEVVPVEEKPSHDQDSAAGMSESESSFHSSDYDTDEKAEMVAIGRRMRQSSKEAADILDDAYNRYTFDDPIDLPRWFADQDPEYRTRQSPIVTKEQVAEMKAYIKSLEAAPSKKEAEAKARRKARAAKKVEMLKSKANSIAEQEDVSASARMKAIEGLYRQASRQGKTKKERKKQYVAIQAGGGRKVIGGEKAKGRRGSKGAYTVLVDRRMKSDKRGIAKARRKGGKVPK